MKLSNKLKNCRADRPDEWAMDEFIRGAEALESEIKKIKIESAKASMAALLSSSGEILEEIAKDNQVAAQHLTMHLANNAGLTVHNKP